MRLQFFCLLGVTMILAGCAALSGPTLTERAARSDGLFRKGQSAMVGTDIKGPDYEAAAGYYECAARNGSAEAAYALAALYRDAQFVEKDDETTHAKSFFWMNEAAVGGWPQAQYELAVFYYEGKGVAADLAQALVWLEAAAENNNVLAQRFLGALYLNGVSADGKMTVKPDVKKGASWYLRAAYNDDGPSQAVMGALYMTGKGIEKDGVQAIKWNSLAAKKGQAGAQKRLNTLYANQRRSKSYEQRIISLSDEFARGDATAGFTLGRLYYYAPAPFSNPRQAVKLFQTTAGKVASSALMMGVATEEGKGIPQNFADAAVWYKKAVDMGQNEAFAYLGSAYLDGRGIPADEAEAVNIFQAGAERGDAKSQRKLAVLYTQGRGLPYDYEKALSWCLEAAKSGDIQAMYLTGAMYEKGIGTIRNVEEARRWYKQAAEYTSGGEDFIREEEPFSWKRDAQKALERLDAEVAKAGDAPSDVLPADEQKK